MEVTTNGKQYQIKYRQMKPWRGVIQIKEFDNSIATGRSWNEPFDPKKGSIAEISGRIAKCISGGPSTEIDILAIFQKDLNSAITRSLGPEGDLHSGFVDEVRNMVNEALETERKLRVTDLSDIETIVEEAVKASYEGVFRMVFLNDMRDMIKETINEVFEGRKLKNRFKIFRHWRKKV